MSWPSTETIVFAGLVMTPAVAEAVCALYVAIKGRPSDEELKVAHKSPWIGYRLTLLSLVGLLAVFAYFWFADPASQSLRDWLHARDQPVLP